ncbi:metal-dependent hydrolase [Niallia taxi]|uniref:metal-dependent hydrolase n=1 Tax=Niallia taxi TaxID=2499688 RepID=UPI00300B419B
MKGTAHSCIGAGVGFAVANYVDAAPSATLLLVGIGGIAALMPDMDIDGKLSNKITISHKVFRAIAQAVGALMILYSIYAGNETELLFSIGAGLAIILISCLIKQRHMLTITGAGVLFGGTSLQETWLILLAIFIIIASFTPHRSYTHSIIGTIYFAYISFQFAQSLQMDGVYLTCLLAYISHLVADMSIFPFNKRGVKLFLPLSSKDF